MSSLNPNFSANEVNERVRSAVRSHGAKIRVLTFLALLLGFFTVAASVVFVLVYLYLYLPKQRQLIHDAEVAVQKAKTNPATDEASLHHAVNRIEEFLGVQIILTHVTSMGATAVAIMVGMLGLGTLGLLSVVILNRRVTLHQINVSLAQISAQLREMHPPGGQGA